MFHVDIKYCNCSLLRHEHSYLHSVTSSDGQTRTHHRRQQTRRFGAPGNSNWSGQLYLHIPLQNHALIFGALPNFLPPIHLAIRAHNLQCLYLRTPNKSTHQDTKIFKHSKNHFTFTSVRIQQIISPSNFTATLITPVRSYARN
jgi:hypothetical protein